MEEYLTTKQVVKMGINRRVIKKMLGEPSGQRSGFGRPSNLYLKSDVEKLKRSKAFKDHKRNNENRVKSHASNSDLFLEMTIFCIDRMDIQVPFIPMQEIADFVKKTYEGLDKDSRPRHIGIKFRDETAVQFLLDRTTSEELPAIRKSHRKRAEARIKAVKLMKIRQYYPFLAKSCEKFVRETGEKDVLCSKRWCYDTNG